MKVYNIKYIIFTLVYACFVQELIHANECYDYANEYMQTFNLTFKNVKVEKFTKWTSDQRNFILPFFSNIFERFSFGNISNQCKDSLIMYLNDIVQLQPWALDMFDATGKPPNSLLLGTVLEFGSFDDCLRIKAHLYDESFLFKGQYCMIHLQYPLFQPSIFKTENGKDYVDAFGHPPDWIRDFVDRDISKRFGLYMGLCTPSVCTEEDLHSIINTFAEPLALNFTITDCAVEIEKENEHKQWPFSAKFSIAVISSLIMLCIIGTYLDLFDRKQTGKKINSDDSVNRELLKSFSIYTNARAVFATCSKKSPIDCIDGLRVTFCIWVMTGHYVAYPTLWKELRYKNINSIHEFLKPELLMVVINNGVIVVEGFFYISGFLNVYILWGKVEKTGGNIGIWQNIFKRYWRLTPVHLFVIIFSFFLPFISSGPVWNSSWEHEKANCFHNGWKNLLYLHNFDSAMDICFLHTWYIAVTMQFVVIFIPGMVMIYKYPKFGLFVCFIILFGSIVHVYNVAIEQGFVFCSYNYFRIPQRVLDFVSTIYMKTYFHFSSNLVGMFSCWIVLKYRNRKLSKVSLLTGWSFCALCLTIALYSVYLPVTDHRIGALYIATRNTIFCLGLSWIVYACAAGYGGVVDKILSWKAFVPISRISYSLYLVHPLFLVLRDAALTERIYMDKIAHVPEVLPYVFITLIFSFFVFIAVEEPCNKIYDILLKSYTISNFKPPSSMHVPASIK